MVCQHNQNEPESNILHGNAETTNIFASSVSDVVLALFTREKAFPVGIEYRISL